MIETTRVVIAYYSRTGNTEKMAESVVMGVKSVQDVDAELKLDYLVSPDELADAGAIIIGMPTYHHDMTRSVKRLFEQVATKGIDLKGKVGASFGSYGWSGEAPRLVLEIMENRFDMRVLKPPILAKYTPNAKSLEECVQLGKEVIERITGS